MGVSERVREILWMGRYSEQKRHERTGLGEADKVAAI